MKKLIMAACIIGAVYLVGCKNGGSGDPKPVLENFMKALSKKDFEEAKKYATAESASILDLTKNNIGDKADSSDKFDTDKVEIGEAKIKGDVATVPVKLKENGMSMNYKLKKESGAWKVAFDKSSLMSMGMDAMQQNKGAFNMNDSLKTAMDELKKIPMDSIKAAMEQLKGINVDSLKDAMQQGMKEGMKALDSLKKHQ